MRESKTLQWMRDEGIVAARRDSILDVVEDRFKKKEARTLSPCFFSSFLHLHFSQSHYIFPSHHIRAILVPHIILFEFSLS